MTEAYNKVSNKFIKNGIDGLTPEEIAELNSAKSDYGYRFPSDWSHELFKNINVTSVIFPETDHRQPGKTIDYSKFDVSLFLTEAVLKDKTFSVYDELSETIINEVSVMIDRLTTSPDQTHSIKGMVNGSYDFIDSQFPKTITNDDLSEMIRRLNGKSNLRWYMNSNTGISIVNPKLEDSSLKDSKPNLVPEVIFGIQVVYDEYMPGVDSGEIPVILADMHRSYLLDIQDDIYLSRTSSTTNDQGKTVDGITFTVVFNIGGRGINGDTYRCLRVK